MMRNLSRTRRWALGGALVGAAAALILGGTFLIVVTLFDPSIQAHTFDLWASRLGFGLLAWGIFGATMGAIIGIFASMIWRAHDDS